VRFQTETLPGVVTDQPRRAFGRPVDRRNRMHRSGLSLDVAAPRQIDADGAEELPIRRPLPCQHDIYRANARFVWGDGGKEAVLGIRALLAGY